MLSLCERAGFQLELAKVRNPGEGVMLTFIYN